MDDSFIKKEVYFEVQEKQKKINTEEVKEKIADELFSNIIVKLDKSVKIVDKIVDAKKENGKYEVRVMLVVEENIAEPQVFQPDINEKVDGK